MCRFELWRHHDGGPALTPSAHPWCAAFTEEDMRLLEDNEDLLYYYRDGYPFNVTAEMTGVLLQDLLTSLQLQRNRFYFAHSETLLPFLTRLGLVRDNPPLSLANLPPTRRWRTSLIGGESANLAVVRLRCGAEVKLQLLLNERPVEVEWCGGGARLCGMEEFVSGLKQFGLDNLDDVCSFNSRK